MRAQDLRRITFGVARRGYDKAEVNAYLNRIAAEVEADVEQARQLFAARELFEREHARTRHEAEMAAIAIRQRGEQDAATARAAAAAALAQAKAEIEATKQEALTQAREMLTLGKGIIATAIDLHHDVATRLSQSQQLVAELMRSQAS
jgi:DivIVA domain-containing protein